MRVETKEQYPNMAFGRVMIMQAGLLLGSPVVVHNLRTAGAASIVASSSHPGRNQAPWHGGTAIDS